MTTIKKLSIQGVRSYSDKSPEVIEFFHPLTIIVGANGSGKTTIIEALKFACTGSLPPLSDLGRSFVHDPKVVGQALVKGQIKLGFRTAEEQPVLTIRSFQLAQQKNKRQFKQLETVLRTLDTHNKQVSISKKCADMDKAIPQLMGVSRAVLENVIFCHQEDSLWPLMDSKYLKEKFDDIFDATRYTKAVELIRKVRSQKMKDEKMSTADKNLLDSHRQFAHQLRGEQEATKLRIKTKRTKMKKLQAEIDEIEKNVRGLGEQAEVVAQVRKNIRDMEQKRVFMENEKEQARERIGTEFDEPDEQLKEQFREFSQSLAKIKGEKAEQERKLGEQKHRESRLSADYQKMVAGIGKIEAQEQENSKRKAELTSRITQLAETHNLVAPANPSSLSEQQQFYLQLTRLLGDHAQRLAAHKKEANSLDADYEMNINAQRKEETTIGNTVSQQQQLRASHSRKQASIKQALRQIESKLGGTGDLEEEIMQAEQRLQAHDGSDQLGSIQQQLETKTRQIRANALTLRQLSEEKRDLAEQQETTSRLKAARAELAGAVKAHNQKLGQLSGLLEAFRLEVKGLSQPPLPVPAEAAEALPALLGATAARQHDSAVYEGLLQLQLGKAEQANKDQAQAASAASARAAQMHGQLTVLASSFGKAQERLAGVKKRFSDLGVLKLIEAGKDLQHALHKAEKKLKEHKDSQALNESGLKLYKQFIMIAETKSNCAVCSRGLSHEEKASFLKKNQSRAAKIESGHAMTEFKQKVEKEEERILGLRNAVGLWDEYERLTKEVPQTQQQQQQLQTRCKADQAEAARLKQQGEEAGEKEGQLREALGLAREVGRLLVGCRGRAEQAQRLQKELQKLAAGGGRELEVVEREYNALESGNMDLNRELSSLQSQVEEGRLERDRLRDAIQGLKDRKADVLALQLEKQRLQREATELGDKAAAASAQLEELLARLQPLKEQLKQSFAARQKARATAEKAERRLFDKHSRTQRECDAFHGIMQAVEQFQAATNHRSSMKRNMEISRKEIEALRQQGELLQEGIHRKNQQLSQSEQLERDIRNNLDYRNRCKEVAAHVAAIQQQKALLGEMAGAEEEQAMQDLKGDLSSLRDVSAELRGSVASEQQAAQRLSEQLLDEKYLDIDKRYREKLVECTTLGMVLSDLDVYYRSLDEALMRYHAVKMKEINQVLSEYWRVTYMGKDIDDLYIKADPTDTTSSKRSYNYRVMMKQGDVELVMRGRCSAGQKVLACLLIRLALAETFCLKCGVLALDEPTTNLDEANIKSFAQALSNIIVKRRGQKNFQLLLITHDDEFVEKIGKRANCDYYYRVFKDQAQHSKIRKQQI